MLFLRILLTGVVPAAFVLVMANWAYVILRGDLWGFRDAGTGEFDLPALGQAIGASVAVGAISFFAPMLSGWAVWLSLIMYLAMIAAFVNLFLWWRSSGSLFKEMFPFVGMAIMLALVMCSPASILASLIPVAFLVALVTGLPWLLFWGLLTFMTVNSLLYHHNDLGMAWRDLIVRIIAAVLCAIMLLSCLIGTIATGIRGTDFSSWSWSEFWDSLFGKRDEIAGTDDPGDAPQLPDPTNQPTGPSVKEIKAAWVIGNDKLILNNYDSQGNLLTGDELAAARLDDQDFAPGVLEEAVQVALAQGKFKVADMANKNERQLYEMVGPDAVMTVLVDRWASDPIAGAGAMVYYDALFGTRIFGGEFIQQYENEPDRYAKVLNDAKDAWLLDKTAYYEKLQHFLNRLYTADRILIEYRANGITDQLYETGPVTKEEIDTVMQDLIVYETYDHDGYFVTFEWTVKGTTKQTMSLRLDCGGQPCNVSELLGVTPAANPNGTKPGKPAGGDPGKGGGKPAGGDPGAEESPQQTKDPSEGTNIPKNDTPGPGPDTNNGVGAEYSSVQDPTGSVFQPSYEGYQQAMDPVENNPGRPGGTSNTPSYQPSQRPDNVDNNGDNGYGWGGADDQTPVQSAAPVDTPNYDPGGAKVEWGGPGL